MFLPTTLLSCIICGFYWFFVVHLWLYICVFVLCFLFVMHNSNWTLHRSWVMLCLIFLVYFTWKCHPRHSSGASPYKNHVNDAIEKTRLLLCEHDQKHITMLLFCNHGGATPPWILLGPQRHGFKQKHSDFMWHTSQHFTRVVSVRPCWLYFDSIFAIESSIC